VAYVLRLLYRSMSAPQPSYVEAQSSSQLSRKVGGSIPGRVMSKTEKWTPDTSLDAKLLLL